MFPFRSVEPGDLVVVAYLGLFQVALAYVFVTRAARVLHAPVLALLLLLEPALTPFWAMWFHGSSRTCSPGWGVRSSRRRRCCSRRW